jgi:hypothetical protein
VGAVVVANTRKLKSITRAKARNLRERPPVTDCLGTAGRRWLDTVAPQIAATATARELVSLLRHVVTRDDDAAFAGRTRKAVFDAERELSRQAEPAYRRLVNDWEAAGPTKVGAGATPGRASQRSSKDKAARQAP